MFKREWFVGWNKVFRSPPKLPGFVVCLSVCHSRQAICAMRKYDSIRVNGKTFHQHFLDWLGHFVSIRLNTIVTGAADAALFHTTFRFVWFNGCDHRREIYPKYNLLQQRLHLNWSLLVRRIEKSFSFAGGVRPSTRRAYIQRQRNRSDTF